MAPGCLASMRGDGGHNLFAGKAGGGGGDLALLFVEVFGGEDFGGRRAIPARKLPPGAATTREATAGDILLLKFTYKSEWVVTSNIAGCNCDQAH